MKEIRGSWRNEGTILLDYRIAGDSGILIYFGDQSTRRYFQRVLSYEKNLAREPIPGVRETIKGFCTLFISMIPYRRISGI